MKSQLTLLILDNQSLINGKVKLALNRFADNTKILHARDISTAFSFGGYQTDIDLIFLDFDIPEFHDMDLLKSLVNTFSQTPVVAFSKSRKIDHIHAVFDAGGMGYLIKSTATETMFCAIRLVLAGGMYVPREVYRAGRHLHMKQSDEMPVASLAPTKRRDLPLGLTPRQFDIVCHVVGGRSNKSIARMLNLSQNTVKAHLSTIFKTMSVVNRTQVALTLENLGWDIKRLAK